MKRTIGVVPVVIFLLAFLSAGLALAALPLIASTNAAEQIRGTNRAEEIRGLGAQTRSSTGWAPTWSTGVRTTP